MKEWRGRVKTRYEDARSEEKGKREEQIKGGAKRESERVGY